MGFSSECYEYVLLTLIKKLFWPIAGQNIVRQKIQTGYREKEGRVRKMPVAGGVRCQHITGKPHSTWQFR